MRLDQLPAFVLHARPYRETSLLLECLTRDYGRVGVVARGVRGGRGRIQRTHLEPFQPLLLDLMMRGELATLRGVEPAGAVNRLAGEVLLSGLYANELVVRLCERQDPHPELFDTYARTLQRLTAGESVPWTLRRFERDLLAAVGYALVLDVEADTGEALDPDADYRYVPEQGACRAQRMEPALRGADLLALAADTMPGAAGLAALRRMMREVLGFHLGGAELRAWRLLAALRREPQSD